MLYLRKNIFSVVMIMLLALVIISCERREDYIGPNVSSEYIQFGVFDPFEQTRAVAYESNKIVANYVLTDEESSDSLFMSSTISDIALDQSIMTRASALTAAPTTFTLCGYRDGDLEIATTKFTSSNLSGGVYSFSPAEYWPGSGDKNFQFYAYANAPAENFEFETPENSSVPTLTYTVPNDITQQVDLVVAKAIAKDDGSGLTTAGVVPLEFNHMLTAIKFVKGEIEDGYIITNIEIRGVYGYGSLDFSKNLNYDQVWTPSGDKTNFSCDGSGLNESNAEDQDPVYFMMMPQELVDAYVYITYTKGSTTKTLSTRVQGTWLPGKVVTYTIGITPQLDLYFDMPNNLYIDAHYVMDDNLKIHVGSEVTSWKLEIGQLDANGDFVKSGADWLKFNNGLHELETKGWWIVDEDGNQRSNRVSTISSFVDGKIWLFAEENIGDEIRTAVIRLTGSGSKNNQTLTRTELYPVQQFAPYWSGNIGSERIEEYPSGVTGIPWGPYYNSTTGDFSITYNANISGKIYYLYLKYIVGDKTIGSIVTHNGRYLGVLDANEFYFDMSSSIEELVSGTNDYNYGYYNLINGWSTKLQAISDFQNSLGNPKNESFEMVNEEPSAFFQVYKKNKIIMETQTTTAGNKDVVNIDKSIEKGYIVWYLPAKNECSSSLFVEPAERKYFETSYLVPFTQNGVTFDNNIYWTSTSMDMQHAYLYKYGETGSSFNVSDEKTELYRVRAVRRAN